MAQLTPLSKFVRVDTSQVRLARIWSRVSSRLELRPRPLRSRWRWSVAFLAVIIVVSASWVVLPGKLTHPAWNGAALETLLDGTIVHLDGGSRLEIFARTRVEMLSDNPRAAAVRIEQGKIICDLVRQQRRFSVFAGDIEVRVTGTRFSVERDRASGFVEVAVERGSVLVLSGPNLQQSRALQGGERWSTTGSTKGMESPPVVHSAASDDAPSPSASEQIAAISVGAVSSAQPSSSPNALAPGAAPVTFAAESTSAKELFEQGNQARRAGDAGSAARAYQALLIRFPHDSRSGIAAFELGRLRMGPLKDRQGAIAAFRTAIAQLPSSALREDSMARLVEAYAASGQTAACRTARTLYLRDYPQGVHAELLRRQCGGP